MAEEALKEDLNPEQAQDGGKREKSSIQFPYLSLEEAAVIAKGVHSVGGRSCQVDQLAAHLNQKPDTGSFRLKLGTTKMFGLITSSVGTVTLTDLGNRLCDSQQEAAARAEAFLKIPLYEKVYEEFKGGTLPPPSGLETAMVNMGVAPKQKDTARQVFQRSATYAGFFSFGAGRLVYPPIRAGAGAGPTPEGVGGTPDPPLSGDKLKGGGTGGDGGGGHQHPFIQGLIKTLPAAEGPWPIDKRAQWLQAAVSVFNLIYTDEGSGGRIEVKIQKDSVQ